MLSKVRTIVSHKTPPDSIIKSSNTRLPEMGDAGKSPMRQTVLNDTAKTREQYSQAPVGGRASSS
jgi:hypothetical protein